jgi:hypothetical protein
MMLKEKVCGKKCSNTHGIGTFENVTTNIIIK